MSLIEIFMNSKSENRGVGMVYNRTAKRNAIVCLVSVAIHPRFLERKENSVGTSTT